MRTSSDLMADTGFRPQTSVEDGLGRYVRWFRVLLRVNGRQTPGTRRR